MGKLRQWITGIVGAALAVWLLRTFLAMPYTVSSQGMENTLQPGDRILVNKWSYGLRLPYATGTSCHRWRVRPAGFGEIIVFNNPADTSQASIGKKETLLARCLGIPGDTLIQDSFLQVLSWEKAGPDRKSLFTYPAGREAETDSLLATLGIEKEPADSEDSLNIRSLSRYEYYLVEQALAGNNWIKPYIDPGEKETRELIVPGKGLTVNILPWNAMLYRNTIVLHEDRQATVKNDSLYIDGQLATSYTFAKDYYWMSSDNSVHIADSRLFGFVPHDHLIGRAVFCWLSKEPDTGLFGGYRWNRSLSAVK